jgi:phosphopantetheinyl transferase
MKYMDLPFANCIVPVEPFSTPQLQELLEYDHGLIFILIDLQKLDHELRTLGFEKAAAQYLAPGEIQYLRRISSEKRRREWLGGRLAAKFAAARMLGQSEYDLPWPDLPIAVDEKGRPFLAADLAGGNAPDISISHSADLAAAMAVDKGLCGIDIQKLTTRIFKVHERFCTVGEERILHSFYRTNIVTDTAVLTRLWAAKESLRKTANRNHLPGFLELELAAIKDGLRCKESGAAKFIFNWPHSNTKTTPVVEQHCVAVSLMADYALALAVRQ